MRSRGTRRLLVLALAAVAASLAVACEAPVGSPTEAPVSPEPLAYSVCPPSEDGVDEATTAAALEVLRSRLGWLDVPATVEASATGACIEVSVPVPDPAVQAAVEGTGSIRLLALPADRFGEAVVGGAVPPDAIGLAAAGDIAGSGARTGAQGGVELALRLAPDAARSVQAFTATSLGGGLLLDVDGVVVATLPVTQPVAGSDVTFALTGEPPIPLRAIEAMLASGPLPEAWTQPQNPQG